MRSSCRISRAAGWAAWQGLVTDGGGSVRQHLRQRDPLHGVSPGPAAPGGRSHPRPRSPARDRLSPRAPAWRSGMTRGKRSAASAPTTSSTTRTPTSACASGSPATGSGSSRERSASTTTSSARGSQKWRYLERNRWATIIRDYPGSLLALCAALPYWQRSSRLLVVATVGGWLPQKLRANFEVLIWLPRLLRERREIQANAAIDARRCLRAAAAGARQRLPRSEPAARHGSAAHFPRLLARSAEADLAGG